VATVERVSGSPIEIVQAPAGCGAPPVWSADGRATVLSCIGCGRIDTAQQCAGTCGEHALEIVAAADHDSARARLGVARSRAEALRAVTARLAAHPEADDCESAYRALQAEARAVLLALPAAVDASSAERLAVWSCGGCGRVEAEAPCVGVCTDEQLEVVRADVHDEVRTELARVDAGGNELLSLVRRLASVTPRPGGWEASLRALRDRARELDAQPAR
jgi:Fe-S-cluster-containing hydrogenase component 2